MFKQIDSKVIEKCFIVAGLMLLSGMVLQVIKGLLIFKKGPPEVSFIVSVTIAYIVMGFLFSLAFYIFRNKIPGETPLQKGIIYSMLVGIIVLIPGVLGMTAFDHEGLFNLFTPYKVEQYFICAVDIINLLVSGIALSILFKKDIEINKIAPLPRKKTIVSGVIGFFLFPILLFAFHVLFEQFILLDYSIPSDAKAWYYVGLIAPLALTGAFLPVLYFYVKELFKGSWFKKSISFSVVFYVFFWIINISFILVFGYTILHVLFYLLIAIPTLILCNIITGYIFRDKRNIGR